MSRVIQSINAMIENRKLIDPVIKGEDGELYFCFKGSHNWSMWKDNQGCYHLTYYVQSINISDLASIPEEFKDQHDAIVSYTTQDFPSKEAVSSFRELFLLLKEDVSGMNGVFDDILGDDDDEVPLF